MTVIVRRRKTMKSKKKKSMLSVKAGIDKNPNPTQADRIAGAKMSKRKKLAGGGSVGFTEQTVSTGKMPKKQKRIQIAGYGKARR